MDRKTTLPLALALALALPLAACRDELPSQDPESAENVPETEGELRAVPPTGAPLRVDEPIDPALQEEDAEPGDELAPPDRSPQAQPGAADPGADPAPSDTPQQEGEDDTAATATSTPRQIDVTVTNRGYEPSTIELPAGEPVRLVFHQEGTSECSSQVRSPELGIPPTTLPRGEATAVTVAAQQAGTYSFVCGMGMLEGTVVVESA